MISCCQLKLKVVEMKKSMKSKASNNNTFKKYLFYHSFIIFSLKIMSLYNYTNFIACFNRNYIGCSPTHLLPDDILETFLISLISGGFFESQ